MQAMKRQKETTRAKSLTESPLTHRKLRRKEGLGALLGPRLLQGRMKHLLSSLRYAWVDRVPGCWATDEEHVSSDSSQFCTLNQSSSESKEFLDLIGKQIKSSCLVEVTEGVGSSQLPGASVQAKWRWGFDALTMQSMQPLLLWKDLRITLTCVLLRVHGRPELRFQEVPQAVFTQFPCSRQQAAESRSTICLQNCLTEDLLLFPY